MHHCSNESSNETSVNYRWTVANKIGSNSSN